MNGKAVNAIRSFPGEGIKVWGARTMDGNSLDWRYINVRRTMIFLEESIKNAARAYVFEPNVVNTWVNMRSMIDGFLRGVWKRGGLAGTSPEDAYSIHIGLGDTMTPEDILGQVCGDLGVVFMETVPVSYKCYCTRDRVEQALISLGREELGDIVREGKAFPVECQFCDTVYEFSPEDVANLLKKI